MKPACGAPLGRRHGTLVQCAPACSVATPQRADRSAAVQNANLVLTASREGRAKGKEPTGEPETLAGRRLPKMGDRAGHAKPSELEELKKRKASCVPPPA